MSKPLCFVVMPFNKKKDAGGNEIDFHLVYKQLIEPAIVQAGMEPVRADEGAINDINHKPIYERLILCDYAVADLTTANAHTIYMLGMRQAVKPYTTISICAKGSKPALNVNFIECLSYSYDKEKGVTNLDGDVKALSGRLLQAIKDKAAGSPLWQLADGVGFQGNVAHEKTDIFRDRVVYDEEIKRQLREVRNRQDGNLEKIKAIDAIAATLQPENEEAGVLIDLMLSYRAVSAFDKMIAFIESMPAHVRQTIMVQEQLGLALNRIGQREEALGVLEKVVQENGPSSETNSIIGRVYKDLFEEAQKEGDHPLAEDYLDKALEAYLRGFEADWRDAYPGVNAVNLLVIKGNKAGIEKLVPVVEYAVNRKLEYKTPDYWDHATLMELAVIENDGARAEEQLRKALSCPIEGNWMPETTLKTLRVINQFRQDRGEDTTVSERLIHLLSDQFPQH